jgi:hypothetical protein
MKSLLSIVGAALLLTTPVAQASTLEQIKASTFELWEDGRAICTGQFVTPTLFMTV